MVALLHARRQLVERILRYSGVSVITIVVTQAVLLGCIVGLGMSGGAANVVATCTAAVPSYVLNRAWVWEKIGQHHVWREIVPFWTYALIGLVLSTIAVGWAEANWGTLAAAAANIATYFVLWILKFVLLDQLIFGGPTNDVPA